MHPSDEKLVDYVMGIPMDDVRRHLDEDCPRCSERVEHLGSIVETMRGDVDQEPPSTWVARALGLVGPEPRTSWVTRAQDWARGLAEEAAQLVTDSAGMPDLAPAGLRSVGGARRLRFETGGVELDLEVDTQGDQLAVTGQFVTLGDDPQPVPHAIYRIDGNVGEPVEGTTDSLGEFSVSLPLLESLTIRLRRDGRILRFAVPDLPLEPE